MPFTNFSTNCPSYRHLVYLHSWRINNLALDSFLWQWRENLYLLETYSLLRLEEALKLLELRMTEDPHNLDAQEQLARAYLESEKNAQKAVDLLEHRVKILSDAEAPENTEYLRLQNLLGSVYVQKRQYEKAIGQ